MNGNAKIVSVMLGYEDHGILTCFLMLEKAGSSQGFGGYRLDAPKDATSVLGSFWIKRILDTVGVRTWEELKGAHIRVIGEDYGDIVGIGHITEERFFFPQEEIAKLKEAKV